MTRPTPPELPIQRVHSRSVDEFTQLVSDRFAPLRVNAPGTQGFAGSIQGRNLGALDVFEVRVNRHEVVRSEVQARQSPRGRYMLHLQLAGYGQIHQGGSRVVIGPGEAAFYNSDRAYALESDNDFHNAILVFPQQALGLPSQTVDELAVSKISGHAGVGAAVIPYLSNLTRNLGRLDGPMAERLGRNTMELLSTLLLSELGMKRPGPVMASGSSQTLQRVCAYIRDHLHDPGLSLQQVADANYISLRSLHAVFQGAGLTAASWIKTQRLEAIRDELADPRLAHLSIGQIAGRHGMTDSSQLSRNFRAAFGQSPREFRRRSAL